MQQPTMFPVAQKLYLDESDPASLAKVKRTGTVILRPLASKKAANGKEIGHTVLKFRCFKDPSTGELYGIPVGRNPDGTYKCKMLTVDGHRFFNLENLQDAKEWHIIQHHQSIKGSKFGNPSGALFAIDDIESKAEKDIFRISRGRKATEIIDDFSENKLVEVGRCFGISPEGNSKSVIKRTLLEQAIKDPEKFLNFIENEQDREITVVIKRAEATGLVTLTLDKGYMFRNSTQLGTSMGAVINYLRKDIQLLAVIDMESKEKDKWYEIEVEHKTQVENEKNSQKSVDSSELKAEKIGKKKTITDIVG